MIKIKNNKQGVSSVIGALIILTAVVLVIAIIYSSYVPAWIKDKEVSHMKRVSNDFTELKETINLQILRNSSSTVYSSIELSGEPLLFLQTAQKSGELHFTLENSFNIKNTNSSINITSKGSIQYSTSATYYALQDFIYENGAVLVSQSLGEVVKENMQFSAVNNSGISVSINLISFVGDEGSVSGTGSKEIGTTLKGTFDNSYRNLNDNITITINSDFTTAWTNFFDKKLSSLNTTDYSISGNTITIKNVKDLQIKFAIIEIEMR